MAYLNYGNFGNTSVMINPPESDYECDKCNCTYAEEPDLDCDCNCHDSYEPDGMDMAKEAENEK